MRFSRILIISITFALASCADWPDVPDQPGHVTSNAWPVLQPIGDIGGPPTAGLGELDAFRDLQTRAARLRLRAALLRSPVTDQDSFDQLRSRLSR